MSKPAAARDGQTQHQTKIVVVGAQGREAADAIGRYHAQLSQFQAAEQQRLQLSPEGVDVHRGYATFEGASAVYTNSYGQETITLDVRPGGGEEKEERTSREPYRAAVCEFAIPSGGLVYSMLFAGYMRKPETKAIKELRSTDGLPINGLATTFQAFGSGDGPGDGFNDGDLITPLVSNPKYISLDQQPPNGLSFVSFKLNLVPYLWQTVTFDVYGKIYTGVAGDRVARVGQVSGIAHKYDPWTVYGTTLITDGSGQGTSTWDIAAIYPRRVTPILKDKVTVPAWVFAGESPLIDDPTIHYNLPRLGEFSVDGVTGVVTWKPA